jgi:hypothetical protein
LIPTDVFQDQAHEPCLARRMAFMLETLKKMDESERTNQYDSSPYDGELNRFKAVWKETLQAVHPAYLGDFHFGKPYDDWFPKVYTKLQTAYRVVGFKRRHLDEARRLASQLLDSPQVPPGTPLVVILNAAWMCRNGHPGRVDDIAKRVRVLLEQAGALQPAIPPPKM